MTLRLVPLEDAAEADWPPMSVELTCHRCGRLIFSEAVRPRNMANFGPLAAYWQDQILAHVASCTPATPASGGGR